MRPHRILKFMWIVEGGLLETEIRQLKIVLLKGVSMSQYETDNCICFLLAEMRTPAALCFLS